ncbi:hypothetical protein RHSIM_Rhsim01G0084700 [Rhododendron simsii]|uniref:Uncharacterized protein n=1 Tax=Rhododendron simsii TaxID=118357 RepID=A0A834HFW0_RHOSS|nr:hypothetical protein RHSIM_Rhsim01G0084700 [Rhododendron simsii]
MGSSSDIDASAPIEKYPYPTEFNVLDFVPKLLSGRNYHKWRRLMRDFIERRGLIGLIDVTAEKEIANQDYDKARNRSDNLVQAWILATLTEDIHLLLTEFKTAKDLAQITGLKETALMVAVQSAGRNDFASKLLEKMTPEDVLLVDHNGDNALHWAAYYGNIEGAKMLVNKNPNLPNVLDDDGDAPLHSAAVCGFRDMVFYLMEVTSEDVVLTDKVGVQLLRALTSGELYDQYRVNGYSEMHDMTILSKTGQQGMEFQSKQKALQTTIMEEEEETLRVLPIAVSLVWL